MQMCIGHLLCDISVYLIIKRNALMNNKLQSLLHVSIVVTPQGFS